MTKARRRHERRLTQLLTDESRWLQKALFALGKAQDAREQLAEARDEDLEPLYFQDGTEAVTVDTVKGWVQARVERLMEAIEERRGHPIR